MTNEEFIDLADCLIYCKIWAEREALHANWIQMKMRESHCGGNGRLLLSSGQRPELRHACGLCAVQLSRTVNELIWTWKSSTNKDSCWTTSCCFVFVLSSRLWSCDQTRHKHPACVIRSQVDRPGGINTCLHANSVGFFTRRKKYLHCRAFTEFTRSLKWFRICHTQHYTKLIKSLLTQQLSKLRDF